MLIAQPCEDTRQCLESGCAIYVLRIPSQPEQAESAWTGDRAFTDHRHCDNSGLHGADLPFCRDWAFGE